MPHIRAVTHPDYTLRDQLAGLLIDAVDTGASVGFLRPLSREAAARYWDRVFAALGDGLMLWVAEDADRVVGSVQLELCGKENGRHRGEIQKLFVLTASRGRGISRQLLETAEAAASLQGRTLLVLDTEAGSPAESVYQHLGWQKAGEIPDYAANPDGHLRATAYYYKRL